MRCKAIDSDCWVFFCSTRLTVTRLQHKSPFDHELNLRVFALKTLFLTVISPSKSQKVRFHRAFEGRNYFATSAKIFLTFSRGSAKKRWESRLNQDLIALRGFIRIHRSEQYAIYGVLFGARRAKTGLGNQIIAQFRFEVKANANGRYITQLQRRSLRISPSADRPRTDVQGFGHRLIGNPALFHVLR